MIKSIFAPLTAVLTLTYITAMAALYIFQDKLIFAAEALPKDYKFDFKASFNEINLPVDGAILNALHFEQEDSKGLIFFLHGNAGNLVDWVTDLQFYQQANYDLFIFDYRGYGKSTGTLKSQAQAEEDVRVAWDFIAPQYASKPVVIYGRSIGSALATELARQVKPALLVLVSPFTSMIDMAKRRYPFAPSWLLRYPFETDKAIQSVTSKVLLIHGDKDDFIPITHSQRLQQLTQQPSRLLVISGANHSNIHNFDSYIDGLTKALP
ncbi:MAG: pimeloyl-ACP methyl ester carboxylesterase [Pseudohongiellaceae bacterium]|jgi:pimeloyl-ACP methyl ester carboxylesterase